MTTTFPDMEHKNKTERAEWGFYIINPITKLINRKKFINRSGFLWNGIESAYIKFKTKLGGKNGIQQ